MMSKTKTFCLRNVNFQIINEQTFDKVKISHLNFFVVSRSGRIDTPGNVYFFTSDGAFFMDKNGYYDAFLDKFIRGINEKNWKKINLYFCDDLVINPKIYDSFVKELCARNIRDYWFETAIDIYNNGFMKQ